MKPKVPSTAFSLPFQSRKKLVQTRICDIADAVAGKKKHTSLPAIIVVLLVCLLSVNLVACSAPEEAVFSGNGSAETVQNLTGSGTASNALTPPDTPASTPKTESAGTDQAADSILKAFQCDGYFYSTTFGKKLTFDKYLIDPVTEDGSTLEISQFAVVDLDRDGIDEVVLRLVLDKSVEAGRAIFHCQDGKVYEYELPERELHDIKTDGSFSTHGGASHWGYARISFTDEEYKSELFTYCDSNEFIVDNAESSEADFWKAADQQDEKADVAWHNFPTSDLATFLR